MFYIHGWWWLVQKQQGKGEGKMIKTTHVYWCVMLLILVYLFLKHPHTKCGTCFLTFVGWVDRVSPRWVLIHPNRIWTIPLGDLNGHSRPSIGRLGDICALQHLYRTHQMDCGGSMWWMMLGPHGWTWYDGLGGAYSPWSSCEEFEGGNVRKVPRPRLLSNGFDMTSYTCLDLLPIRLSF